ncbi:MAG: glycerol-3-phosphate 1-O-acyltransferase [Gammaproteobacteria bacterium]|nr:glycerol-3-phosphate 1-O-acyltransferase [Gammaproteobacteria bacterium]MBT8152198.1 glycerol-3-phosphate 1-O-acyltransferase [Gammaproteobacteria bacterium]NND38894.1 glycerol-3-phosphate 1-O-acyltransferase [Pseudomonadales bacterium]NNM10786.1 glycerol-3-phosphate 1-O-acyltransferase [Pseudomonadales bacterium]
MNPVRWPQQAQQPILFILDAALDVEVELLRDFIEEQRATAEYEGDVLSVVLPIFRNQEDIPSEKLAQVLKVNKNTQVVPVRVAWLRSLNQKNHSPRLRDLIFGDPRRPGPWRARRYLRGGDERVKVLVAKSASIEQLETRMREHRGTDYTEAAFCEFVAGQAGLALDLAERSLRGNRYRVPRRVATNLMHSPSYQKAMQQLAADTGTPSKALEQEAEKIMQELIATPRSFWIDVMAAFTSKFVSLGYESEMVVDQQGLERVRKLVREYPTALVWTHKTHVDGFAVFTLFYDNDFPAPHVLGGINMAFAGLGYVAKRAGGIFIRRSFKDNKLYKIILRQYIAYLLEKRFPLTWAFEGTRSRVGKLMPPRYGVFKYVIEAAHAGDASNLHFIPIAINYDLIGDVDDYTYEQSGGKKQAESLRWFINYMRGLRQPLGRIYVNFGEPVIIEKAPQPGDTLALQKVAFQVGVEVNRVTPLTLPSVITMILLGAAPRALTAEELSVELHAILDWARAHNVPISSSLDPDHRASYGRLLDVLVNKGLVTRYDGGPEEVFAIAAQQHATAGYYRNTVIHHFVIKAIGELALLYVASNTDAGLDEFWQEAERLRDLFKFEFFYSPIDEFRKQLDQELVHYYPQWEARLMESNSAAQKMVHGSRPLVAHAALLPFVEAYRVVADVLAIAGEEPLMDNKECVRQSLAYARQAFLQQRITSEASIGKLMFENGYKLMANQGLVFSDPESLDTDALASLVERRAKMSQTMRELCRRIDTIRSNALLR